MIKIINEVSKNELKEFLYNLNLEDENIYKEMNKSNVFGIFQFDGGTASNLVKKIVPKNFDELVAINALARPGTIDFAEEYNHNKETGESKYNSKLETILKSSHNVPLFQEQTMQIFNLIGCFSLEETNEVRSLMKKLGKADKKQTDLDKWSNVVEKFITGAVSNGLSKKEAELIADDLLKMSSYNFNRSHAVAYTYTAVMTLYLSYYFKPYFYSSTLTYEAEKQDNLKKRLDDCRIAGFTVLPPDINRSELHFYPENNNIRFGLNEIKFVGETPANTIINNRPYTSLFNFFEKNMGEGINIRTTLALIRSGAFDSLINKERKKYGFIYEQFNERKKSTKIIEKLKFLWDTIEKEANSLPGLETTDTDLVEYEKEYFGFPIFSSLFSDKVIKFLIELNKRGLCELYFDEAAEKPVIRIPVNVESYRTLLDKNGKEMAFLNCSDLSGVSKRLPIFQSYWKHVKEKFTGEGLYLITVYAEKEKDNEIYFGAKKWTDDATKSRMLKRIK